MNLSVSATFHIASPWTHACSASWHCQSLTMASVFLFSVLEMLTPPPSKAGDRQTSLFIFQVLKCSLFEFAHVTPAPFAGHCPIIVTHATATPSLPYELPLALSHLAAMRTHPKLRRAPVIRSSDDRYSLCQRNLPAPLPRAAVPVVQRTPICRMTDHQALADFGAEQ